MDMLITTEWLAERQGEDDLRVLDASYHMGGTGRDPATEFEALHMSRVRGAAAVPSSRRFADDAASNSSPSRASSSSASCGALGPPSAAIRAAATLNQ